MRFPEFRGEWEEHTLSEYLEFKNGLNPDAKRIGNGLPFISVMDILSEGVIRYDNIRGKVDATEKEIECFGVKNGDIGAIDKPCGESVRRLTQKHVAKRYMIAEKLLSLHHES